MAGRGGRKGPLSGVEATLSFSWRPGRPPCALCPFQTLQRAKPLSHPRAKKLQEAPGCPPEADDPVLPSPTTYGAVPAGWPYLSGGGSCHLGDLRELWQAGWRRATFVLTPPPPLGTAFTI